MKTFKDRSTADADKLDKRLRRAYERGEVSAVKSKEISEKIAELKMLLEMV